MWGGQTKDNDEITRWMRIFPRTVATASGAAVVLIDHITKNAETRGRFAIGGQAKLATIDGAAYLVEPLEALSPGRTGTLTMRVTKDRPGFIRKVSGMWRKSDRTQETAIFTIDSTKTQMQYVIGVPKGDDEVEADNIRFRRFEIMEYVHANPGASRRDINTGIKGDDKTKKERTDALVDEGFIDNRGNKSNFIFYVTDKGKAEFNLFDAEITHLGDAR
jgi:predicted transcriptional regulator